jgi:hypothetical protein
MQLTISLDVPSNNTLHEAIDWLDEQTGGDLSDLNYTASEGDLITDLDATRAELSQLKRIYGLDRVRPDPYRSPHNKPNEEPPSYSIHPNVDREGNYLYLFSGDIAGIPCRLHVGKPRVSNKQTVEAIKHVLRSLYVAGLIDDPPVD